MFQQQAAAAAAITQNPPYHRVTQFQALIHQWTTGSSKAGVLHGGSGADLAPKHFIAMLLEQNMKNDRNEDNYDTELCSFLRWP